MPLSLNTDQIRCIGLAILLPGYPFFAYVIRSILGMEPNYVFGLLIMVIAAELILTRLVSGQKIRLPYYIVFFGLFMLYDFLVNVFISGNFHEIGAKKFLYTNFFLMSFCMFLVAENTTFPRQIIGWMVQGLFGIMLVAALVSLVQTQNPFFFLNAQAIFSGERESVDRLVESTARGGEVINMASKRLLEGYRLSIYSWIGLLAVGIDGIANYSLLLGIERLAKWKRSVLMVCGAFISFLSSSRWIMLNYLLVSSQVIFTKKNWFLNGLKFLGGLIGIVGIAIFGAMLAGVDMQAFVQERLLSDSAGTRIYAFKVFGRVYFDNPIFGTGAGDTAEMLMLIQGRTSQIHVGYLKLFYYYGLVGGVIYLSFLASLMWHLYRQAKLTKYWGAFFAVGAFLMANVTLVEFSLFYHSIFLALIFARFIHQPPATEGATEQGAPKHLPASSMNMT